MRKTEQLRNILTEIIRKSDMEPKILEQRVFDLWRKHLGIPFGTKTMPMSLSEGVLKIYTEYPPYKTEILLHKESIIANLNAELDQPILTDLRIELRLVSTATPSDETIQHESPKSSTTATPDRTTAEKLEQIEQILASVTDERLKKSLRQLFMAQSTDKP